MIFPRHLFIGKGAVSELSEQIVTVSGGNILAVISRNLHEKNLDEELICLLERKSSIHIELSHSEPHLSGAEMIIEKYRRANIGAVVGLGGGSVLDLAKAVAVGLSNNSSLREIITGDSCVERNIQLFLLPTTAGSGSEVTNVSVLFDENIKKALVHECLVPDGIALDPQFLKQLPPDKRLYTFLDATSHAIESLCSINRNPLTDFYATSALSTFLGEHSGYLYPKKTLDDDICSRFLLASMNAGLAFTNAGVSIVHAVAYAIVTQIPVSHGQSIGIALVPCLKWVDSQGMILNKRYDNMLQAIIRLCLLYEAAIYRSDCMIIDKEAIIRAVLDNRRLIGRMAIVPSRAAISSIIDEINTRIRKNNPSIGH